MLGNPSTWLRLGKDLIARWPLRLQVLAGVGGILLAAFGTIFGVRVAVDALVPTPLTRPFATGLDAALLVVLGLVVITLVAIAIYAIFYRAK